MLLEQIPRHQRVRLPSDWGRRDDETTWSLQESAASRDNKRKMHYKMKNHNVDEVGSNAIPPTIGIWAGRKSSTILGDYIPFLLSIY